MTTAEQIMKVGQTLEERGIPHHSKFFIAFADGSEISEEDTNWSDISEETMVEHLGSPRMVRLCTLPVVRIAAAHDGIEAQIDVPDGCQVYQSIRGQAVILATGRQDRIVGRYIGLVKDGQVIEEKYIDGLQFEVRGVRK